MSVFLLSDELVFPPPYLAEKNGLLAIGGTLTESRLLLAYQMGIFPWFSEGDPVLWWSPDPRLVLYPDELRVSKSLSKIIKKNIFNITMDTAFHDVINECAAIRRENNEGTWIVDEMIDAYIKLHESGYAHSVEVWFNDELAGGLYGVSIGKAFFGESMFARINNASKVAFVFLVDFLKGHSVDMIDCQVTTRHLKSFGAREIQRKQFLTQLKRSIQFPTMRGRWGM